MRLITAILNTSSAQARADQTRTLLGWGFSSFEKVTPIQPNTVVGTAKVSFGKADTVAAGLGAPWMLTVQRGQQVQTSVVLNSGLEAPVAKGAVIGKVVATSNGKPVGEAPLVRPGRCGTRGPAVAHLATYHQAVRKVNAGWPAPAMTGIRLSGR